MKLEELIEEPILWLGVFQKTSNGEALEDDQLGCKLFPQFCLRFMHCSIDLFL